MWRKNRNSYENNEMCVGVDINRNFPTGFKHVSLPSKAWLFFHVMHGRAQR